MEIRRVKKGGPVGGPAHHLTVSCRNLISFPKIRLPVYFGYHILDRVLLIGSLRKHSSLFPLTRYLRRRCGFAADAREHGGSKNKISLVVNEARILYLTIESATSFYTHEDLPCIFYADTRYSRDLVCIYYILPFIIDPRTERGRKGGREGREKNRETVRQRRQRRSYMRNRINCAIG